MFCSLKAPGKKMSNFILELPICYFCIFKNKNSSNVLTASFVLLPEVLTHSLQ